MLQKKKSSHLEAWPFLMKIQRKWTICFNIEANQSMVAFVEHLIGLHGEASNFKDESNG
jgi:hypothetical protein